MQPLLYAALALAAGIVAAASGPRWLAPAGAAWLVCLLAAAAIAALLRGRRQTAAALALAFCVCLGYDRAASAVAHPSRQGVLVQTAWQLQQQPRQRVFVTGFLRDRPLLLLDNGQPSAVRLDLEATSLAANSSGAALRSASGGVRLYAYPPRTNPSGDTHWSVPLLRLSAGAGIAASLHLRPLRAYNDPGVPDFSARERRQGIVVTATLAAGAWKPWPMALHPGFFSRARARLWGWLSLRLDQLAPPAAAPRANALLRGMLLGDVARLSETTRTQFQVDGVYHLLVVAGLHIGVLAALLWWLLRLARCPRNVAAGVSLLLLAGYAWTIAGRTPTLRALLMLAVYFGARCWYRERQALNAVGVAALLLLLWRPLSLYRAGFQMSFAAALLLAGVVLPLLLATSHPVRQATRQLANIGRDEAFSPKWAQFRLDLRAMAQALAKLWRPLGWRAWPLALRALLGLYDIILISLVLQIGLAGFNAGYFHRASPWSIVANALLVPAAGVLIPLGWLGVIVVGWGTLAARAASWMVGGLAHLMLVAAAALAQWPGANWRVPSPPGWFWLLLASASVAWIAVCTVSLSRRHNSTDPYAAEGEPTNGRRRGRSPRQKQAVPGRSIAVATAVVVALVLVLLAAPFAPRLPPGLSATILDVGQGDSIFVAFPDGRTMLVDGGPRSARWDTGEAIVAPFLWSLGLHRIDAILLTHAHNDHLGGLGTVLADFHPSEVWVTRTLPTDAPTRTFLRQVKSSHALLRRLDAGDAFRVGASRVTVLLPAPAYQAGALPTNDDSMVVRVSHNGSSMLLEGDAESIGERWMLAHHLTLASAVLKVGHHGSKTSSTPAFLDAVHARAAIISVGAGNSYGQPAPIILERLRAAGARVFRTDRDGAVQCRLRGNQLSVYLFRRLPGQ